MAVDARDTDSGHAITVPPLDRWVAFLVWVACDALSLYEKTGGLWDRRLDYEKTYEFPKLFGITWEVFRIYAVYVAMCRIGVDILIQGRYRQIFESTVMTLMADTLDMFSAKTFFDVGIVYGY